MTGAKPANPELRSYNATQGVENSQDRDRSMVHPSLGATGRGAAYYSVFSMGPLLLIVISIAGLFLGADAVRGSLTSQFRSMLGETGSKAVEAMLAGAS